MEQAPEAHLYSSEMTQTHRNSRDPHVPKGLPGPCMCVRFLGHPTYSHIYIMNMDP